MHLAKQPLYFISCETNRSERHGTFGGKADNLFRLREFGGADSDKGGAAAVPAFVVIPQEAGMNIFSEGTLQQNNYETIRAEISDVVFPEDFIERIVAQLNHAKFFAVRSSAADEDGGDFSFAGQFESELFVTPATMAEAIKKVWRSAWSERVRQYRENNRIQSKQGIAVIVQEMIDADAAGVAFGANPASGDRNEKIISAVFGLGEGLVSGELNADNYYVKNGAVRYEKGASPEGIFIADNEKGGTKKVSIPANVSDKPVLTNEQALQVATALDTLKKIYGRPQDIEFAFRKNQLYLLQARPITSLHNIADPNGRYIVWDNSNIIESYPGVTSPLTFSFIIRMYEAVYNQFGSMMGIRDDERAEHAEVFANMLGLLDGRVYYNLRSWYKLLSLLPGYSLNAGFMEKMMGVKERFELDDYVPRTKFRERLRIVTLVRIMLKNLRQLPRMRRDFQNEFDALMVKFRAIDLDSCDSWKLMQLYKTFEQTMLKRWKAPLVNDFFAMIYYGTLQKLVVKYGIDENGTLHNDLLCGARDIISTDPVRRCTELSEMILTNAEAKTFFGTHDEHQCWQAMQNGQFPAIKQKFDEYISLWGDRCVGELKLENLSYRQNPAAFVRIIQSYVTQGVDSSATKGEFDLELRRSAEAVVQQKLKGRFLKKWIFNYVLRKSRDLVSNRENLRFARTRGFGMVRDIFRAIGRNFYAEGLIENPDDIFFLKKEELFDYIQGTAVTKNLRSLIALRKNEYVVFAQQGFAERIPTRGIVYLGNDFSTSTAAYSIPQGESGRQLKGIGCCPGRVTAKVRIVHSPDEVESLNGDILVTSSTDPGWVTLFPTASAILVERGSLLSHSAIVSREMGKPCIVGVNGLLATLKSGDLVEMDGKAGTIHIL